MLNEPRKGRGKGSKPAMQYVSFRVENEVFEFFNAYPNRSAKIREVLVNFIKSEKGNEDENSIKEITEA